MTVRLLADPLKAGMAAMALLCSVAGPGVSPAAQLEVDGNASGPFSLVDHMGTKVTDDAFRGKFMLVFFGYTSCPDVCPMDLQILARAIDGLGKAGDQVQPIFITVDPARDTPEVIAEYASHFHPRLIGLTGTRQQAAAAARNYGVISMKIVNQDNPQNYSINHSALTYLLGPDGKFVAAFDHGTDIETLTAGILQHLTKPVE